MIRYFAIAACGLLVGWLAHATYDSPQVGYEREPVQLQPPGADDEPSASARAHDALDARRPIVDSTPDDATRESAQPTTAERRVVSNELFSAALLNRFEDDYRRAWLARRSPGPTAAQLVSAEAVFKSEVLLLPAQLGSAHAEEQDELDALTEALAELDGIAVLAALTAGRLELPAEELTGELLDKLTAPKSSKDARDGADFIAADGEPVTEGMTIRFGAGVFELDERRLRGAERRSLPADVTIVGAGMDATLLRIGDISINSDVQRLSFRDLTIDAQNNGLFDHRSGGAVLDLERVRIVRFDAAHGGCFIFAVREGVALRARQCRFEGGYGRSPGRGDLLRAPTVIARFEDCHFELMSRMRFDHAGRVEFRGCSFTKLDDNPILRADETTVFVNCAFSEPLQVRLGDPSLAKDLGDLFWQVKAK